MKVLILTRLDTSEVLFFEIGKLLIRRETRARKIRKKKKKKRKKWKREI